MNPVTGFCILAVLACLASTAFALPVEVSVPVVAEQEETPVAPLSLLDLEAGDQSLVDADASERSTRGLGLLFGKFGGLGGFGLHGLGFGGLHGLGFGFKPFFGKFFG